ncbi:MAG: hypothetical protein DWH91_08410 [Planctomycetota bacterium]|nr:MAG: hypothetical protein DWH91_08410 [Planctomycetota bacterium]
MTRQLVVFPLLAAAIALGAGACWHRALAEDPTPVAAIRKVPVDQTLRDFMRKKLDASNQILEGLALDDTDLIEKGAGTLAELSEAEQWRVSKDALYRQFSMEFTRNAEKLKEAAKDKNIDRAALRWMDATMSCIECHRFVRNELVVKAGTAPRP